MSAKTGLQRENSVSHANRIIVSLQRHASETFDDFCNFIIGMIRMAVIK